MIQNKLTLLVSTTTLLLSCNAQIKNAKTETVKIYGNCGMCESTIEKAGNKKRIVRVDWNKDTKVAALTFDSTKTNQDEILKRIALSGYDNDKFLAPDDVYAKLHECCQYDRKLKLESKVEDLNTKLKDSHYTHNDSIKLEIKKDTPELKAVFDNYFALKDALVKTDGQLASTKAKELQKSIKTVKIDRLTADEHTVWMKVMKDLNDAAGNIAKSENTNQHRVYFMTLSNNIYTLIKSSKNETPIYYQFCPMANDGKGANWLSKEQMVKNPYYGSLMLNCGKVVETIK